MVINKRPAGWLFLSTPSGWRATRVALYGRRCWIISIHALRVEGDGKKGVGFIKDPSFLSTPSGWRATFASINGGLPYVISIHALRVEGDLPCGDADRRRKISIHALRVEGDASFLDGFPHVAVFLSTPSGWRATMPCISSGRYSINFYPRPPGGGRPRANLA